MKSLGHASDYKECTESWHEYELWDVLILYFWMDCGSRDIFLCTHCYLFDDHHGSRKWGILKKYKIELVNIEEKISTSSGKIKIKFKSPNKNSVHLRWEPLITEIVNKFNKCNIFYKNIKIDKKKEKEWLKRKRI